MYTEHRRISPMTRLVLFLDALALAPFLYGIVYVMWWGLWEAMQAVEASDGAFRFFLVWLLSAGMVLHGWVTAGDIANDDRPQNWRR